MFVAAVGARGFRSLQCPCFCPVSWLWASPSTLIGERVHPAAFLAFILCHTLEPHWCSCKVWEGPVVCSLLIHSQSFSGPVSLGCVFTCFFLCSFSSPISETGGQRGLDSGMPFPHGSETRLWESLPYLWGAGLYHGEGSGCISQGLLFTSSCWSHKRVFTGSLPWGLGGVPGIRTHNQVGGFIRPAATLRLVNSQSGHSSKLPFQCSFQFLASVTLAAGAQISAMALNLFPLQILWWRFAPQLQFSDRSMKSHWLRVCSGFLSCKGGRDDFQALYMLELKLEVYLVLSFLFKIGKTYTLSIVLWAG